MKTLKTIITITAISLFFLNMNAQDYEFAMDNAKKIVINDFLGKIIMENHDDSKLLIKTIRYGKVSEKAKGLKEIYGGHNENTGIGLSIIKSDNTVRISGAGKRSEDATYHIFVPKNISVKIDYSSPFANEDIIVSNFSNELEIETLNPGIALNNITGPVTLHAINGEIKAVFISLSQESPSSITTINNDLDITIPANTKADIEMNTINGGLYTNHDIDFEKEKSGYNNMKLIGGGKDIEGTLNGGGVKLSLNSVNGSVYLRK